MTEWPFDLWLGYAVRGLGLSPSAFWDMSIRDWMVLMAHTKHQGVSRQSLQELMQEFPDRKNDNEHG